MLIIRIVDLKINKIVKHILIIGNVSNNSSSISPSVQVLRQQIRGGGGSKLVLILLTQGGGWGVPNQGKLADVILERSLYRIGFHHVPRLNGQFS